MVNRNIFLVSLGYFFLFVGFAAAQQYLVPLLALQGQKEIALTALIVLYIAFIIGTLVTPWIIGHLGVRWSLVAGSLTHAVFIASIISGYAPLMYVTGVAHGIGGAMLWISNVRVIDSNSDETNRGRNLGFQQIWYWSGSWLGVAGAGTLLGHIGLKELYFLLAASAFVAPVCFIAIKGADDLSVDQHRDLRMIFDRRLLLLFPLVFSAYFLSGMGFSALNLIALGFGIGFVGLIATVGQGSRILGTALSGWFADKFSKSKSRLLYSLVVVVLSGSGLILLGGKQEAIVLGTLLLFTGIAAIYPAGLSFLRTHFSEKEHTGAVGVYFLYSGVGSTMSLFATLVFDPRIAFLPGCLLLAVAIPGIYLLQRSKGS